jgi:hypothetical protein
VTGRIWDFLILVSVVVLGVPAAFKSGVPPWLVGALLVAALFTVVIGLGNAIRVILATVTIYGVARTYGWGWVAALSPLLIVLFAYFVLLRGLRTGR